LFSCGDSWWRVSENRLGHYMDMSKWAIRDAYAGAAEYVFCVIFLLLEVHDLLAKVSLSEFNSSSILDVLVTVTLQNRINLLCKDSAGLQFLQVNSRARVYHCIQNGNGIFLLVCGPDINCHLCLYVLLISNFPNLFLPIVLLRLLIL
jgi:hypothetical protein